MANYLTLVEQLSTAVDQLNEVLQGDENTTVTINGQQQPSVQKKTLDEVNAKIQLVLDAAADIDAVKYATTAAGIAATTDGQFFSVVSSDPDNYLDLYKNQAGVAAFEKSYPTTKLVDYILSSSGKNKINIEKKRTGFRVSPASGGVVASTTGQITEFIPVNEGDTFTLHGVQTGRVVGYFTDKLDNAFVGLAAALQGIGNINTATGYSFQVPTGQNIKYAVVVITEEGKSISTYDNTAQLETGIFVTSYEGYFKAIPEDLLQTAKLTALITDRVPTDTILNFTSVNLVNPDKIDYIKRYSQSTKGFTADTIGIAASDWIPVAEGEFYTVHGDGVYGSPNIQGGFFTGYGEATAVENISESAGEYITFQVPVGLGITHVVLSLRKLNDDSNSTELQGQVQLQKGTEFTGYKPYNETGKFREELMPDTVFNDVLKSELTSFKSFNKIDPDKIDYTNRYSTGNKAMQFDTLGIAASEWIPVEEGEFYTLSGEGVYGYQGGYFTNYGETTAIDNIVFIDPPAGEGKVFQVPIGQGITHVLISLKKLNQDPNATQLDGPVQLEVGELATLYQPFKKELKIKQELIAESSKPVVESPVLDATAWFRYTEGDEGAYHTDKLPKFRRHWLLKDKDLVVINTGTSLTARSSEHCTDHPDAEFRPPLMHSNNMASIVWDAMKWDNQHYRRYGSGYFNLTGNFSYSSNLPEWDDGPYRAGTIGYSEDVNAAVGFEVPVDAWQFNFIYRTDTTGCDAIVNIAEGNGQMEVLNESDVWVEANGHIFSMREDAPVDRDIGVPKASDNTVVIRTIPSKGNTTYQKRLKMRCKSDLIDSRASVKNVTVSSNSVGRFMYWGVEWSPREFMITYINAARGSHNTQAAGATGLPRFADNEVWSFKPDLMFFELPIHNDGAAGANSYTSGYFSRLTNDFVFRADYELSMKTRSAYFGLNPEFGMFTSSISWNFNGIAEDGTLKYADETGGGKVLSALDKYNEAYSYVLDNHPDAVFINSAKRWVDAGNAIFGDLKAATVASGKNGNTFTNEGSHWNDTGSKIIAKTLTPVFRFV